MLIAGTTLGLLRVPGIALGPKHRVFDTPGVPHDYQLTSILAPEEVRMLLPRRRLKPRTYRVPAGSTLLIGGVARLDVLTIPGATVYLTAFVSGRHLLPLLVFCIHGSLLNAVS